MTEAVCFFKAGTIKGAAPAILIERFIIMIEIQESELIRMCICIYMPPTSDGFHSAFQVQVGVCMHMYTSNSVLERTSELWADANSIAD